MKQLQEVFDAIAGCGGGVEVGKVRMHTHLFNLVKQGLAHVKGGFWCLQNTWENKSHSATKVKNTWENTIYSAKEVKSNKEKHKSFNYNS